MGMPGERLSMRKIREVLRLRFAHRLSQRAIGQSLRLSAGAVNGCLIPTDRTVDSNVNRRDAAGCDSPSLPGKGDGDDGSDHTAGTLGGGAARGGGADAGRKGGASAAGDGLGTGRQVTRGCGRGLRNGPPDAARLGAPLQRVWTGGSVR